MSTDHDDIAAHLGITPRGRVGVIGDRRHISVGLPGAAPTGGHRHLGPVGRCFAGVRSRGRAREDGSDRRRRSDGGSGGGLAGGKNCVRPVRLGRPYLFSVPMWNAGIPYILKQFIDVISQPGLVFSFDPELGYTGLLTGRKAAVVYTSAIYGPGRPPSFGSDFQAPYLRDWLNWAGIQNVTEVAFRPNLATADADLSRQAAHAAARDAAKVFAGGSLDR